MSEYVLNYELIKTTEKQIAELSPTPLYVEGRDGRFKIEEYYADVIALIEAGEDTEGNVKAKEYIDLLANFTDPYFAGRIEVNDPNALLSFTGRTEAIATAEKQSGIKYPREVAWVTGAEAATGIIELPSADCDSFYVVKGTLENPQIIFINEGQEGDSAPYYYKNNGKVFIVMDGFSGGGGTQTSPYTVATVEELQAVGSNLSSYYIQTADIDASATSTWNEGRGFTPIANLSSLNFTGNYNGNGFKISNLTINRPTESYVGLFGRVSGTGSIKNVTLVNAAITGFDYIGGMASYVYNPTIENSRIVDSFVTSKGTSNRVGGFTGYAVNGTFVRCSVDNCVIETLQGGGFIGYSSYSYMKFCKTSGEIKGVYHSTVPALLAGFVLHFSDYSDDRAKSYLAHSESKMKISLGMATYATAQLSGFVYSNTGRITYCVSSGLVENSGASAGFCRHYTYKTYGNYLVSTIGYCFFSLSKTTRTQAEEVVGGALGLTDDEYNNTETFPNFYFDHFWIMNADGPSVTQRGTKENPYPVYTLEHLRAIAATGNGHYKQYNNIDAISTKEDPFKPIPDFTGVYDGQGYRIWDLYIDTSKESNGVAALFNNVRPGSTLKNIFLHNIDYTLAYASGSSAGLVYSISGTAEQSGITNTNFDTEIINCHIKGVMSGGKSGGGIVNRASNVKITNSSFRGYIEVQQPNNTYGYYNTVIGGLGTNFTNCDIYGCYSEATLFNNRRYISSGYYAKTAGLAADITGGFISHSFARTTLRQSNGQIFASTYNLYNQTEPVSITECYGIATTGLDTASSPFYYPTASSTYTDSNVIFNRCYYDSSVIYPDNTQVPLANLHGKTSEEMRNPETYIGWDIGDHTVDTWYMVEYPELYYTYDELVNGNDGSKPTAPVQIAVLVLHTIAGKVELLIADPSDPKLTNGNLKIQLKDRVGVFDLLETSDPEASKLIIKTKTGNKALRKAATTTP